MKYQNFYLGITLIFFLAGCDVNVSESSEAESNPDTAVQGDQSSQEGFNKTITLDNGQDIARESMMLLDGGLKVPDVTTQDGASVSAPGVSGKTNVDGASRTYRFDQVKATSNGEEILLSGEYEVSESGGVTTLKGNDLKITGQQGDVVLSEFTVVTDRNNAVPTLSAEINADFSQFNRQVSIQIDPAFSGSDPLCPINGNMKIRAGDGSYVVVIAVPGGNLLLDINGEYITVSCGELKEDASTTSDSGASSTEDTSSGTSSSSSSSESSSDEPESPETSSPETPSTSPSTGTDSSTSSDSPPTSSPEIPSTDISSGGSTSDEASQSSSGGDSNVTVSISDCSNLLIEIKGDVVTINCGGTGSGGTGSGGTGSGGTGSGGTGSGGTGSGGTGSGGTGSGISPPSGPGSDGTGSGGTSSDGTSSDGISSDGISSDGTSSDGTGSGGTSSGGTSSDGTSSDGTSSDGTGSGGTSSGGTSSDGTSSDGTSSDGTSSDGTSSDGTSSDGTSSDGTSSDGTGSGITPPTGPSSEGSTSGGTSSDDGTSSNGTDSDGTNSDGTTPSSGGLTPPSAP